MNDVDLARLFKLRVIVARVGEMDRAQWWNTRGQLGPLGAAAVSRGLPRTHGFARARSVFAVAAHRCDEIFNPPGSITLWRLPDEIEERFDARWEHWLDNASEWGPFFDQVAELDTKDPMAALHRFHYGTDARVEELQRIQLSESARSVLLPTSFRASAEDIEMLALGFTRSRPGMLVVPYARLAEA